MKKCFPVLMLVLVVSLFSAGTALALPFTMTLSSGASSITITDNGAGDINPVLGAITFSGAVGEWALNVTTGLSKPVLPNTPTSASMDLNSVDVSSSLTVPNALQIALIDYDFALTPAPGYVDIMSIGGTTSGTVSYEKVITDSGDGSVLLDKTLNFTGPSFSQTASFGFPTPTSGFFNMEEIITITHPAGAGLSTSFDASNTAVAAVPEPATMVLFGTGLIGLAGLGKKKFFCK